MPAPPWHPSRNAHPVRWEFRNGQHGEPYGALTRVGRGVYRLTDALGRDLGEWTDPDAAAVMIWDLHLAQHRARGDDAPNGQR